MTTTVKVKGFFPWNPSLVDYVLLDEIRPFWLTKRPTFCFGRNDIRVVW